MLTSYRVLLTEGAAQEMESLCGSISDHDDPALADHLLDQLLATADKLQQMPERGNRPRELLSMGIKEYRQVFSKPHPLIHRVMGPDVVVYVIADGRRDMQALLARRLLGA